MLTLPAAAPRREAEEKETVQVSVVAILATERDNKIDPKLACIAREVQKTHKKLTGFQMAKMTRKPLTIGVKETFELVGEQKAAVTVQQGADEKNRIQVKVAPPQMGEITYGTCCGKFLPIVTPFRTKNNDLLILAVRVQPCHGK
ncbi:MAG TPA: hypothetical protein VN688_31950 [Gemmataceae bacterium]|nr:hypothetical protein [Gemmataceae bacterium]